MRSNTGRTELISEKRSETKDRKTHEIKHEDDFEKQRDDTNHGTMTHEIQHDKNSSRHKEPIRTGEKTMTTKRRDDFSRTKGTSRIMFRQPTKPNAKRDFERQRTDTNGRTTYENTDTNSEDTFREPKRYYEPWEDNPCNQTRHRLFEKDKPREQIHGGLSRTAGSLPIMRRQPMNLTTKTIFRETKNRYKWEDNLIPMKTETKTTVGHQRDVTNHGKSTHETKRETDFSRDKESIRPKGQPTKSDTKTTSENQKLFQQWEDNP